MRQILLVTLLASSAVPAAAAPLTAGTAGCGGDAYSYAEVIEGVPARRGPVWTVPDTLCADVAPRRRDPLAERLAADAMDLATERALGRALDARDGTGQDPMPSRRLRSREWR